MLCSKLVCSAKQPSSILRASSVISKTHCGRPRKWSHTLCTPCWMCSVGSCMDHRPEFRSETHSLSSDWDAQAGAKSGSYTCARSHSFHAAKSPC